jgi:hypothetical protein
MMMASQLCCCASRIASCHSTFALTVLAASILQRNVQQLAATAVPFSLARVLGSCVACGGRQWQIISATPATHTTQHSTCIAALMLQPSKCPNSLEDCTRLVLLLQLDSSWLTHVQWCNCIWHLRHCRTMYKQL